MRRHCTIYHLLLLFILNIQFLFIMRPRQDGYEFSTWSCWHAIDFEACQMEFGASLQQEASKRPIFCTTTTTPMLFFIYFPTAAKVWCFDDTELGNLRTTDMPKDCRLIVELNQQSLETFMDCFEFFGSFFFQLLLHSVTNSNSASNSFQLIRQSHPIFFSFNISSWYSIG